MWTVHIVKALNKSISNYLLSEWFHKKIFKIIFDFHTAFLLQDNIQRVAMPVAVLSSVNIYISTASL